MGKIKRLLDRFDEMGRYPIQELGYSRTWLMFSYLGAFLVHRCTIADYFLYHFYERNRRGRAEFVTLYDMRDIHRKNPQTAFADFEEKDRFLDRFQAYVHRDWIGRVCRNSREEFDAFADRHPRCIIKPRTDSGGHGVELCTITPNNRDQVWERLTSQDMIAEELLEQCPEMAALHPSSGIQSGPSPSGESFAPPSCAWGWAAALWTTAAPEAFSPAWTWTPASSPPRGPI